LLLLKTRPTIALFTLVSSVYNPLTPDVSGEELAGICGAYFRFIPGAIVDWTNW